MPVMVQNKTVGVIGLGNVGSQAVQHLARMPEIGCVVLVDFDTYDDTRNLRGQDITPADIGRPKVLAQARRLRRIAPHLRVVSIHARVESIPLAQLRADVLLSCVDSRAARGVINEIAHRLNITWVDSGVHAPDGLARVNVYVPSADGACFECGLDDDDYADMSQQYPCAGAATSTAPTNAPSSLGALAAALQVIECQKILAGDLDRAAVGREVLIDATWHRHYVTTLRRNPKCRFDHRIWEIEPLTTSAAQLSLAAATTVAEGPAFLRVDRRRFVTGLICPACGASRRLLRLADRLSPAAQRCPRCPNALLYRGFDLRDRLDPAELPARARRRSLAQLGLQNGDVFTIAAANGERHFQISGGS